MSEERRRYGYDLLLIALKVLVLVVCAARTGQFIYQAF